MHIYAQHQAECVGDEIRLRPFTRLPAISYELYFRDFCLQDDIAHEGEELTRVKILTYNRADYGVVDAFVKARERSFEDCHSDPLFAQIPVLSARRKMAQIKKLPSGKTDGADLAYEKQVGRLLPSLLYPSLDFAQEQVRTDSGVSIRDLIFIIVEHIRSSKK